MVPLQEVLEIKQDSTQETKQDIQDSNSFYPYKSSYPHLASQDKNAGVEALREGEQERENQKQKYYIDKEGYLQGLDIIKYPITKLEFTSTNNFKPKAIVLHRTDSSTAKSTLEFWSNPNTARVGAHFLIDIDGTIYQCASLHKYTQHIGKIRSKVKETGTWNKKEQQHITSLGWNPKATSIQLSNLEQLVLVLLEIFGINKSDIHAHGKIAYKDKNLTEGACLLEYLSARL